MSGGPIFSLEGLRVFVAGHRGMVGSAILRRLEKESCLPITALRQALDLTRQAETEAFFARERPDVVILAAARVGGIRANDTRPVEFLYENLAISQNVIGAAHGAGVRKLLYLGSSCVYPKLAPQPMSEDALLTGPLEPTNQWYAIAKIAGIKLCQAYQRQYGDDFIAVMPTNLYGRGDNYDPETSHVSAALIRRMHEAKGAGAPEVVIWGTGTPRREFLAVDDLADGCIHALTHHTGPDLLNIGTGTDLTIAAFASLVAEIVGYRGRLVFDATKPDGAPQKLLDVSRMRSLGWSSTTALPEGLKAAYADYLLRFHPTARRD